MSETTWLTVRETAARLGKHEEAVRTMIREGKLRASRASTGARAPWLIDAAELERQIAMDAEVAAARERLDTAGVVLGRGEEFLEKVGLRHGPAVAEELRTLSAHHDARYEAARALDDAGAELQEQFDALDDDEAIEQAARRRATWVRREERIRQRTLELLDEEDER